MGWAINTAVPPFLGVHMCFAPRIRAQALGRGPDEEHRNASGVRTRSKLYVFEGSDSEGIQHVCLSTKGSTYLLGFGTTGPSKPT